MTAAPLTLLAILAHPDDESMGVGGTLAKYASEGVDTHLVCATRGEAGWFGPQDEYPGPFALGQIREQELLAHFNEALSKVEGLRIFGHAREKAAVVSFLVEGAHAHDLATLLDLEGIAIRSGHHCAHPLMAHFGVPATCRASLAFYNTHEEIEAFVSALQKVRRLLG